MTASPRPRQGLPRHPGGPPHPPLSAALAVSARVDPAAEPPLAGGSPGVNGAETPGAAPQPRRSRIRLIALAVLGLLSAAVVIVLAARWAIAQPAVAAFVSEHPGAVALPESAPVGLPAWIGWQHFLNAFFLVLIVRTGIQVRTQHRPPAFWEARRRLWRGSAPPARISVTLWAHLALDLLWIVNGLLFVALLFLSGQWMRVVPTSWEIVPNALSAALQYAALDWPHENGWLAYNSLQVLAYCATIFVAAPLAAVTGIRMSPIWPQSTALSRWIPLSVVRPVHYGVMLYFVAFTIVHVGLVLASGPARSLNHIFTSRDADDPWGIVLFLVSVLVMALAAWGMRPAILTGIARGFGRVSR